ncbi:MAG: toll/interleukin-1 receptor domain-containing protein, partial [bacterium]|nr:toll/interleukin-1 receptor domain-containing protein [bacterium]
MGEKKKPITSDPQAIFISYSSKDDVFVKKLRERLEALGLVPWVDTRQLRGGDVLKPAIKKAIQSARAFILVLGPHTFNSSWVRLETQLALKQ